MRAGCSDGDQRRFGERLEDASVKSRVKPMMPIIKDEFVGAKSDCGGWVG